MPEAKGKILVVDDEESLCNFMSIMLRKEKYEVATALDGLQALKLLGEASFDLVIADLKMPQMGGLELLSKVRELDSELGFIVLTAFASLDTAIEALKMGANDYITKPFKVEEIKHAINRTIERKRLTQENRELRRRIKRDFDFSDFVGSSRKAQELKETARKIAQTESTVLIYGESGTGKELIARAIHNGSRRSSGPFVSINCAALPESLLESELFGHIKGSFTGAVRDKEGLFKVADKGTFFLDEVGETSPSIQVKLLRVLEEREITPVGGTKPIKVDVRLVAATNADLEAKVKTGKFRPDLFYRLNVIPLYIPPLRERKDDIGILSNVFLERYTQATGVRRRSLSPEASELMLRYPWPGNVRELENVLERAVILARGNEIKPDDLPASLKELPKPQLVKGEPPSLPTIEVVEKAYIYWVLKETKWQKSKASEILGIDPSTLYRKIERYSLSPS